MNRFWGFGLAFVSGVLICAQAAVADGFVPTGDMPSPRYNATATLLPNGKVLVAGGFTPTPEDPEVQDWTDTAVLYDPATGMFVPSQSHMIAKRVDPAAVLLADGKVLLVGGGYIYAWQGEPTPAEIYDPATDTFTATGTLTTESHKPKATLLPDGKVLVVGGMGCCLQIGTWTWLQALKRAEIYDPATGVFTPVMDMAEPRADAAMVPLADGRVLVTGGRYYYSIPSSGMPQQQAMASAEIYEYPNPTFGPTNAPMTEARAGHAMVRLQDDSVLVAYGAYDDLLWVPAGAERFGASAGVFATATPPPAIERTWFEPVLLDNGNVLMAGGAQLIETDWTLLGAPLASADLYVPSLQAFVPTQSPMSVSRDSHAQAKLADGRVLIAGGVSYDADSGTYFALASAEIYDPNLIADRIFEDGFDLAPPAVTNAAPAARTRSTPLRAQSTCPDLAAPVGKGPTRIQEWYDTVSGRLCRSMQF